MGVDARTFHIIQWAVRILALLLVLFGLPFYFGYGNPLPFVNPDFTFWDTLWACTFPLVFFGLALGWKWEKVGGYMILVPITLVSIIGLLFLREGLPGPMMIPTVVGGLYLFVGYHAIS